jgi:hypothetical protein|tara:strand:- start:616 stop:1518 length:903 start_codon:yes stop_codon:yes gene_type:complete
MSEEALKQEEVIEEEGEVIDLEESKPEEPAVVETPTEDGAPEVVTEEPEPEKSEEELQDYSDKVQKRINTLTRKLREAERGQDSAYEYAKNLAAENERLKTTAQTLQQTTFDESATRLESQKAQAMASLQKAHEVADYEKVAQAQDVLAKIAVQEQKVQEGKIRMEQMQKETPVQQPQATVQQQPMFNSKMQDWIDDGNDWFLNNAVMHETGTQIHEDLVTEGFVVESDEYFAEVNKRIRTKHPEYFNEPAKSKPSQKVASAGRVSGKSGKKQIRLSPSEVQMAKKLNVPLTEYAKYVKR